MRKKRFLTALVLFLAVSMLSSTNVLAKKKKVIDVLVFAGQSNMMGHGDASAAPKVKKKVGVSYLPISKPKKISDLTEPFGRDENDQYVSNVYDGENYATGSMVSAFAKAYNKESGRTVLAVPCAMPGTGSYIWAEQKHKAISQRTTKAIKVAKKAGYKIGHVYLVWMQGESDALAMQRNEDGTCDSDMSADMHIKNVRTMYRKAKKKAGFEKCFIIKIPSYYGDTKDPYGEKWSHYFKVIQDAQDTLCEDYDDFVMAYSKTPKLGKASMQSDGMHMTQAALNKVGKGAGKFAGKYSRQDQ